MNQRYFITSTGTGLGKSFITAALVRQAKALGRSVMAMKPVVTGFNAANINTTDTGLLLRSLDMPPTDENIDRLSPWRFATPLAPTMAGNLENRVVDFDALVVHSRAAATAAHDVVLIEGIGGLMVPLFRTHTVLNWIEAVDMPVLLVVGSYLGSLSHTLTALTVLQQRQVPVHALIINESENSTVGLHDTADELSRFTRLPIVPVKRRETMEDWDEVSELRPLFA